MPTLRLAYSAIYMEQTPSEIHFSFRFSGGSYILQNLSVKCETFRQREHLTRQSGITSRIEMKRCFFAVLYEKSCLKYCICYNLGEFYSLQLPKCVCTVLQFMCFLFLLIKFSFRGILAFLPHPNYAPYVIVSLLRASFSIIS